MEIHVYHFSRSQGKGLIVYRDRNGNMIEKTFPACWTDAEILMMIGKEIPLPTEPKAGTEPEKEQNNESEKETEVVVRKRVSQEKEDKRTLRAKYLHELKAKGFDFSGERSFARIEAAYLEKCQGK